MSEYIVYESKSNEVTDYLGVKHHVNHYEKREEIVRCRDCYFADEIEGGYWCDRFDCGKEHVTPDGFCKWGELKEGCE